MQEDTNAVSAGTEFPQSPDNINMPVADKQASCRRPKMASDQSATATLAAGLASTFPLRPPAGKQMGVLLWYIAMNSTGKIEEEKKPDCSLSFKVMQEERYTMSFSHSKGSSYDCKTSAITQGLFHEVS